MNPAQQSCEAKKVGGALFMDVKSAFNNATKMHLGKRMEALDLEPDLIRWTGSFMSNRQVKLVLDGQLGQASGWIWGPTRLTSGTNALHHLSVGHP